MNKKILFLGIGGIGVSALAIAASKLGAIVAGYDSTPNKLTKKLQQQGIRIYSSPSEVDISVYSMVVYSSAILDSHPLLSRARSIGVQCLQRAMFLSILMDDFENSIAVTGTHGKTTTSSILATLLYDLDLTSSFVVGGVVKHTDSNIEIRGADKLTIEADESDASFLNLNPKNAIITNIDLDHMQTYKNSYHNLLEKFYEFLCKSSIENIYLCIDDNGCRDLLSKYKIDSKRVLTYGFATDADAKISNYNVVDGVTNFELLYQNQLHDLSLSIPGKYNVQNAVACVLVCFDLGFSIGEVKKLLIGIKGVARRFDTYNKTISGHRISVIDDYGHHPAEIASCLSAVKDKYPNKKIIHIFQPHRYTRNRDLFDNWLEAFSLSDSLIMLPTYSAGEEIIKGAETKDIAKNIDNCILVDGFDHAIYHLEQLVSDDYVVLIQGAGDVGNLVEMLSD